MACKTIARTCSRPYEAPILKMSAVCSLPTVLGAELHASGALSYGLLLLCITLLSLSQYRCIAKQPAIDEMSESVSEKDILAEEGQAPKKKSGRKKVYLMFRAFGFD